MLREVVGRLTFDEMMEAIRQEVRLRRANERPPSAGSEKTAPTATMSLPADAPDWSAIEQNLGIAEQFAPIATLPPQFVTWGKYRRTVALGVARGIMYLSRFITNKQAHFNESLLAAVRQLSAHTQGFIEQQLEIGVALKRHEAQMRDLHTSMRQRLDELTTRIADVEAGLRVDREVAAIPRASASLSGEVSSLEARRPRPAKTPARASGAARAPTPRKRPGGSSGGGK